LFGYRKCAAVSLFGKNFSQLFAFLIRVNIVNYGMFLQLYYPQSWRVG